jgi:hypothetical protein
MDAGRETVDCRFVISDLGCDFGLRIVDCWFIARFSDWRLSAVFGPFSGFNPQRDVSGS